MVFGIPGTDNILEGINIQSMLGGIGQIFLLFGLFIIVGLILWFGYYLKKKKAQVNKIIFWFEEVHGEMVPIGQDKARELIIPGTNISVFYIKEKDMYLPRPVKRMGKDAYWFVIRNNREIVNFVMKNINDKGEGELDFDHTDQRYALTNLKALIQRNYRDKSQTWWREYKEIISLVILIFVLTMSFIFIISKLGTLIDKVGVLIDHADQLIKLVETKGGSGIIMTI